MKFSVPFLVLSLILCAVPANAYDLSVFGGLQHQGELTLRSGVQSALANYGGGVKILPAATLGARIDIRGYTVPSVQSQTLNIIEVSVGVVSF
jgi:hypothetical protein